MNTLETVKILGNIKKSIFTAQDIKKILGIKNSNTLYKTIEKLTKKKILTRTAKGVYFTSTDVPNEFQIANALQKPSYISLESALNFYGILIQTPYQIISVTPERGKQVSFEEKEFIFCHISPRYFWGYKKLDDFLIADKEKAVVDEIYFKSKGREMIDFEECDLSHINKGKLKEYARAIKWPPFQKLFKEIFL